MNVTFVTPHFMAGDDVLAVLNPPCILRHPAGSEESSVLPLTAALRGAAGGVLITYAGQGWKVEDRIECVGEGEFLCERTWCNESGQSEQLVLSCSLDRPGQDLSYVIPAVSYDGNGWGRGQEPKGLFDSADAEQSPWVFGGDRCSVPACTISEDTRCAVALHGVPAAAAQSGCGLEPLGTGLRHWLFWPLQEWPRTYTRRDVYAPAIRNGVELAPGESCACRFFILIKPALRPHGGTAAVLDSAWARFRQHVPAVHSPEQLWDLGARFAKECLWVESDQFVGFSIGLTWREGRWMQAADVRYEIGWCGQNGGFATMLLQDYLWSGSEDSWRRGAAVLDLWADHGRLANGLIYTHFEDKLNGIENPELDTCNLGHGAYQFLLASTLAEQAARPQPNWRATGLGICDFFTEHVLPGGKLGRSWYANGEIGEADGTSGCSLVWALALAYRLTGEQRYLSVAERAYRAYAEDDLARWQCTAGALDTDCIDKETAFALLLPGLDLYEITGDRYYLEQAEAAASYLASWQWHYNLDFAPGTPAAAMGYATFGGTSVSVQHHHLDPWGALIALGWLRLSRITGKTIWAERAAAAWRQATIGVSDGTLALKGIVRPAGGQDEGFYHTRWGGAPGGVSDWLVAWPAAFRMITLQGWDEWEVLR
jgi:hypothetical protein